MAARQFSYFGLANHLVPHCQLRLALLSVVLRLVLQASTAPDIRDVIRELLIRNLEIV